MPNLQPLLFLIFILGFLPVYAVDKCEALFAQSSIENIREVPLSFHRTTNQSDTVVDSIFIRKAEELARTLIASNADLLVKLQGIDISLGNIYIDKYSLGNGDFKTVFYKIPSSNSGMDFFIPIRTNGKAAFLGVTYQYRESHTKHYKAAYFEGEKIKTIDQGQILLAALPENLELSRVMSELEKNNWLSDDPFVDTGTHGIVKIHFAPRYFEFGGEPYLVPVTKKWLIELYKKGLIEINIYNPSQRNQFLRDKIDIEYELVFVGDDAVNLLRPILKKYLSSKSSRSPRHH